MSQRLNNIEELIRLGAAEEAIRQLDSLLEEDAQNSRLFYLKGQAFMKTSEWGKAISQFRQARLLEPDGPAAEAENMLLDIMDFYNKDMYNQ